MDSSDGNRPNILKSVIRDFWSTIIDVISMCLGQGSRVSKSHTESCNLGYYHHVNRSHAHDIIGAGE